MGSEERVSVPILPETVVWMRGVSRGQLAETVRKEETLPSESKTVVCVIILR